MDDDDLPTAEDGNYPMEDDDLSVILQMRGIGLSRDFDMELGDETFAGSDDTEWESCNSTDEEEEKEEEDISFPFRHRRQPPRVVRRVPKDQLASLDIPKEKEDSEEEFEPDPAIESDPQMQRHRRNQDPLPTREEIGRLILDYYIFECYREPAVNLCAELGIELPTEEFHIMDTRISINNCIIRGDMETAISKMNELCPTMLESHPEVRFNVHKQHLIEMIRSGESVKPILYAREHLVGAQKLSERQLEQLEKVYTLLAFDVNDDSPFHCLYDLGERQKVAKDVNKTLLKVLNRFPAARLSMMYRLMAWGHTQLVETKKMPIVEDSADFLFGSDRGIDEFIKRGLEVKPLDLHSDLC